MMDIPSYIASSNCQQAPLSYVWDSDNPEKFENLGDTSSSSEAAGQAKNASLLAQLQGLSQRANVAWSIACGEWIFCRLAPWLNGDIKPLRRLEGAWAQVIDPRYCCSFYDDSWDREGPVNGPMTRALALVQCSVDAMAEDRDVAHIGASIARLAVGVLADSAPFLRWQARTMERLTALYALDPEETMGEAIPREALDPDREFDPLQTEALIDAFLTRLDKGDNPFILPPDDMLGRGFVGEPYRFSIEADRDLRFNW